jgi:hypothetical protein
MKISITISALILAAAVGLGWLIDGRLAAARVKEHQLTAEAQRLGISDGDAHSTRSANRVRIDRNAEAKLLAVEQIQLVKALEQGGRRDEAWKKRSQECNERIAALDASGLKILITDLLASEELSQKGRAEAVSWFLSVNLAEKDPRGALAFATEHVAALSHDRSCMAEIISNSLGNWAKDDPLATVEWMRKNAAEFPDAMRIQARSNVISAAAKIDPKLAFTLIAKLGLDDSDSHNALHTIVTVVATDEQRNATLAALREYREAHKDDKEARQAADQMVGYFAWGFKEDGFAAGSKWLASANLTPKELDRFCGELTLNYNGNEHAQWIEWIGGHTPPGKSESHIMDVMRGWTYDDYEAAGKWLATVPDGPVKIAATRSYALTIFKHDPETAMQWIMTLPSGKDRDATLKHIHINWPKDDPAGKEAFAKEHGIK